MRHIEKADKNTSFPGKSILRVTMLINVGGLWDKPIPITDDETFPTHSIEAPQSDEEYTYFENFCAGTNLGSGLEYDVRAGNFDRDLAWIFPDKQLKSSSAKTIENQCVSGETKGRKRVTGIQRSEDISSAHSSKTMRVLSRPIYSQTKVNTARGPRDTRVRLSLSTAVKLFEVQDKLRYKHPSKVLDWLISKAQTAIDELPQPVLYASKTNCTAYKFISKISSTPLPTELDTSTTSQSNEG